METRELKLKLFNESIDRFFAPYFVSNLENLQTILTVGANLLNNINEEDYNYLLNVFSNIANRKMKIGTAFFKNCLIENFIRLEKD